MNASLNALVGGLYGHLAAHPLPAPITVEFDLPTGRIDLQVKLGDTVTRLRDLLAWGHSLHQVTVTAWHTPRTDLHLMVQGRAVGDITVNAYASLPGTDLADLLAVAAGDTVTLTLDELAALHATLTNTKAGAA